MKTYSAEVASLSREITGLSMITVSPQNDVQYRGGEYIEEPRCVDITVRFQVPKDYSSITIKGIPVKLFEEYVRDKDSFTEMIDIIKEFMMNFQGIHLEPPSPNKQ